MQIERVVVIGFAFIVDISIDFDIDFDSALDFPFDLDLAVDFNFDLDPASDRSSRMARREARHLGRRILLDFLPL